MQRALATAGTRLFQSRTRGIYGLALGLFLVSGFVAPAQVVLGPFTFDSTRFGNSLLESDGGAFSSIRWLNTVNINPGNPNFLTGPHFNTGIANIGLNGAMPLYTIGYQSPIINGPGADLGVVVARFSTNNFLMAVSTDGGATFSSDQLIEGDTAQTTGVGRSYYFAFAGPYDCTLFVHSIDLGSFGLPGGAGVNAVRITSGEELDLIRVAGFLPVPEPGWWTWIVLAGVFVLGRRLTRAGRRQGA